MSDRRRSLFVLLVVFGLIAASVLAISTRPTKLGLDLQGGVQLVYEAKPTAQQPTVTQEALQRSLDLMRERVDALGVSEPELQLAGDGQIEVNLPGVENAERAAQQVGSTAQLFFYDWEKNILDEACKTDPDQINGGQSPITGFYRAVQQASKCPPQADNNNNAADGNRVYAFDEISHRPLASGQAFESETAARDELTPEQRARAEFLTVPTGILVVRDEKGPVGRDGKEPPDPDRWWIIQDNPALSGTDIKNPEQNFDQTGGNTPIVTFEFTNKGREAFSRITREIAQRGQDNSLPGSDPLTSSQHFAIVLDNELVSSPYINFDENPDGIDGSTGAQISGGFTITTAQDLAKILEIGALPLRLELVSRSQVSASLGARALDQGLIAGIAGFGIVALFLLIFYRVLGVIAVSAMAIYALYFYAIVELLPIVLTLPGIAGLILTLGVAADANIVIFERVKEEIRAGRGVGQAISAGYKKGLTAIMDANIVTILVAFILFTLATAGVRGFALTLGLGVILSLFTAVLATQAILYALRGTRILRARSALGAGDAKPIRFDFMGRSKWFFSASGLILLVCALALSTNGLNLGIDFEGGTRITAPLERPATVDQVREALAPVGLGDAEIQTLSNEELGDNVIQVSAEQLPPDQVDRVEQTLERSFGFADDPSSESIGPSFGQSVATNAVRAIIASLVIISIYIALRFQWKFAVPVLIALTHDVLITGGVYALVGREVTASTVAALLTILGFSLYDTIVVFDRVRENVPRMPSAAFTQIYNRSMSEVIVRSLATSFCAALPILALMLFGGETLRDFAFALLVGTLSGTYSSVFIAGPVLALWKEREPTYRARAARIAAQFGHVPAYATPAQGGPVDVAPETARRGGRITAPADPTDVSRQDFDDMVANLGLENDRPAAAAAGPSRPAGGRRGRRDGGTAPQPPAPPRTGGTGGAADGDADETRERKPRNRRHGRPR
jgi:SecD/SecF fusion protein